MMWGPHNYHRVLNHIIKLKLYTDYKGKIVATRHVSSCKLCMVWIWSQAWSGKKKSRVGGPEFRV